jgi:hypothetical protein
VTWPVCSYTVMTDASEADRTGDASRPDAAAGVLDRLAELEPELRAAAVVTDGGEVLASTVDDPAWDSAAIEFLAAVEDRSGGDLDSAHVAAEDAEVFVVREQGVAVVAVTARFVLASLTSFDMRMGLRDLAREATGA